MSDLPAGWLPAQLSELLFGIEAGLNVKCEERPPADGEKGLVKISAVTWGKFDELQSKTLPVDAEPDERNRISAGDLLISRANTIELVGASVIVGPISRELYLSDKVLRLCVHEPSKRWINYALKTPAIRKSIEEASSGNQLSMRNISQEKLKCLSFPLAPEPEQTRIADKLDTVLARVDAVNARLERVAPLLKRFRQAVLAAATTGQLSLDSHTDGAKQQIKVGQDLLTVPAHWATTKLTELIDPNRPLCYGVVQPGPEISGGRPLIRVQDIVNGCVLLDNLRTISLGVDIEFRRSHVVPDDVLVSIVGTIGRSAVVPPGLDGNIARAVARVTCGGRVIPKWVHYWIESPTVQWWLTSSSKEVARKTLNLADLAQLPVGVPERDEQAEIVRRVELLFGYADRLEARLKAAQTAAGRLTPALLAKAFRGELVPQDPNDEPASELLRRLAESRAAAPERKTRGRRAAA